MKKKIRVNTKILKESSIKVGDKNYEQRLRRRVTDLRRVSQMAKSAAIKAEEAGNTELAKKLNDRVEEIEKGDCKAMMEAIMAKPLEELKELYNTREIEK